MEIKKSSKVMQTKTKIKANLTSNTKHQTEKKNEIEYKNKNNLHKCMQKKKCKYKTN